MVLNMHHKGKYRLVSASCKTRRGGNCIHNFINKTRDKLPYINTRAILYIFILYSLCYKQQYVVNIKYSFTI